MYDASLLLLSTNRKHKKRFYECTASFKIKTNASTVKQHANSIKKIKIQFVGLKAAWMKTKVNQRYRWSARGARFLCCKSRASGKVRKKMVNSAEILKVIFVPPCMMHIGTVRLFILTCFRRRSCSGHN